MCEYESVETYHGVLHVEVDPLLVGGDPDLDCIVDRPAYDGSSMAAIPGVVALHPPLHRDENVEETNR